MGNKEMPYLSLPSTHCSTTSWLTLQDGRGIEMGAVTITVDSTGSFRQRVKAGFAVHVDFMLKAAA